MSQAATKATARKAQRRQEVNDRIRVMSHPLRREILQHVRDKGEKSPVEISWEIGADLSKVSYHVRELVKLGRLEKTREERVRGVFKSFYVATERPLIDTEEWEEFSDSERENALIHFMQPIVDDFTAAVRAGTLGEKPDWIITRTPIHSTDQQGFEEMREAHRELFERVTEIQAESVGRMRESGEAPLSVTSGQTCFAVPGF